MSAKDRDRLYHHAKGVGDSFDTVTVTKVHTSDGQRFKVKFSKLPDLVWGPYDLTEMIRELQISALLTAVNARDLVFDAAVNGEATTETG